MGTESAFRVPRISKRQKSVSRAKPTLTTSELMESSQRQPPWSSLTPECKCHASEQSRDIEGALTGHLVTKKSRCSASDGPGRVRLKGATGSTAPGPPGARVPVCRPGLCCLPLRQPDLGKACWETGTRRVHSRPKVKGGGQPVRSEAGEVRGGEAQLCGGLRSQGAARVLF